MRIETSPLDLSTATNALTSAAFLRHLMFSNLRAIGFNGMWAWGSQPSQYQPRLRKILGATENDLVIPGGFLHDPLIEKPVEWLNDQMARYGHVAAASEEE